MFYGCRARTVEARGTVLWEQRGGGLFPERWLMASIHKELIIVADADSVWSKLRDEARAWVDTERFGG
jgi:hypothetical protein